MFHCDQCHEQTAPREKAKKVVVETRAKTYDDWKRGGKLGHGHETVREITVCPRCAGEEQQHASQSN